MNQQTQRLSTLALTALLTGCAADNSINMPQSIAANMLNNHCHRYINDQQLWQIAKLALGDQASSYEDKICSCASEQAAQNMNTSDLINVANENTRNQTLIKLIAPTVTTCYNRLIKP